MRGRRGRSVFRRAVHPRRERVGGRGSRKREKRKALCEVIFFVKRTRPSQRSQLAIFRGDRFAASNEKPRKLVGF